MTAGSGFPGSGAHCYKYQQCQPKDKIIKKVSGGQNFSKTPPLNASSSPVIVSVFPDFLSLSPDLLFRFALGKTISWFVVSEDTAPGNGKFASPGTILISTIQPITIDPKNHQVNPPSTTNREKWNKWQSYYVRIIP